MEILNTYQKLKFRGKSNIKSPHKRYTNVQVCTGMSWFRECVFSSWISNFYYTCSDHLFNKRARLVRETSSTDSTICQTQETKQRNQYRNCKVVFNTITYLRHTENYHRTKHLYNSIYATNLGRWKSDSDENRKHSLFLMFLLENRETLGLAKNWRFTLNWISRIR